MRLVTFGNNTTKNLVPISVDSILAEPTPNSSDVEVETVLWHSWTCTVTRDTAGKLRAWGLDPVVELIKSVNLPSRIDKVVGVDSPAAFVLDTGGLARYVDDAVVLSKSEWADAAVTDVGVCLGVRVADGEGASGTRLVRFNSLEALFNDEEGVTLDHPLFGPHLRVFGTESRLLILSSSEPTSTPTSTSNPTNTPTSRIFELVFNFRDLSGPPTSAPAVLEVINELEGLGVERVRAAPCNRFSVVTSAGDAYLFSPRGDVEPVDLGIDLGVCEVAVGAAFEVVLDDQGTVWVRGSNDFGELGLGQVGSTVRNFTPQPWFKDVKVTNLHCGRWSTIATIA